MDIMMDKNKVKKVLTHKSGQFVFSSLYDRQKLAEKLSQAITLNVVIAELPILPEIAYKLEDEIRIRSVFSTAAIEGNPLPEKKVAAILRDNKEKKPLQQNEKEIENLKHAYEIIREISYNPNESFKLSEDLIKKIHTCITTGIPYKGNDPGCYRNHLVRVGNKEHGGVYTPPRILADIEKLMQEFIVWINSEEMLKEDGFIRAALAHYYLGLIHPFGDGNGRAARIVEALLLTKMGARFLPHMLSNFYYQNIDDYFWAFSLTEKNKEKQITPFVDFFLQGVVESLEELKARIISMIRGLVLKDYYEVLEERREISQRQYDLLRLLLNYSKDKFGLHELFDEPMFQLIYRQVSQKTARRDLDKLKIMNLLTQTEKQYALNWHILEQAS